MAATDAVQFALRLGLAGVFALAGVTKLFDADGFRRAFMAQPEKRMRLIWVADIVGYATRYRQDIPWADVRRRYPFVLTALSRLEAPVG